MSEEDFVESINAAYPGRVKSAEVLKPKRVSLLVDSEGFLDVAVSLRDEFGFTYPLSGGAVDYPKENRMQMMYYLMNPSTKFVLIYRVNLPRENPILPTLTRVWEAMSFHEREAYEMFGIRFEGHPNLIPLLLPPDWRGGYPLRKDFKGEGVGQ